MTGETRARSRNAIALTVIAIAFLIPLRGLLRSQGPPMEEGFMLVFPERVLAGDFPNKDFLHLYGPGSLWVLAGVFKAFGTSLEAQRIVALLQQAGVVLGVFGLARYWGRTVAVFGALIALVIIVPPIGLTALAWVGGVALGMLGLVAGFAARRATDERRAGRLAVVSGVLLAGALLYRLDLVLAVGLSLPVLLRGMDTARARRVVIGLGAGSALYLVHAAIAGPGNVIRGMVLDPVFFLRGGRRLPIPPPPDHLDGFLQRAGAIDQLSWRQPALSTAAQLTVWFFLMLAAVAFLVVVAVRRFRRDPQSVQSRVLLAAALFSVGLLPQGIQRVDSAHFAWVTCVPLGLLPVGVLEVMRGRARRLRTARAREVAAGGGVLLALFLLIPHFTARTYTDYALQSIGVHRIAFEIEHEGRRFYYGRPDVARAAEPLLAEADRITEPGDRLFVGTTDLRKTPYSDAYLYYMLHELTPATYYIEMDPGVANRDDSGLDDDLASADIAILSSVWNDWEEPNDSRDFGSDEPNKVLKEKFCLVDTYGDGLYELYERCDRRSNR
ncbi:MAG TPA: hypothetical protein VMQ81_04515 [Acidimicrobiia bacterium]|nr:hypothetical protein [Acidimicrobiia bacterium]